MVSPLKIGAQQFYYSTVSQFKEVCVKLKECAVIVDASYFESLVLDNNFVFDKHVNQLIVVGNNLNKVLGSLGGKELLVVAASNVQEALQIAVLAEDLNKKFVCVLKESEEEFKKLS